MTYKDPDAVVAAMARIKRQTQEDAQLERDYKHSAIKSADLNQDLVRLAKDANERAERAEDSSRKAGRFTIYAMILAILSAIISLMSYYRV